MFIPENVDEEICLLLYLGQNATLNEAVLDWQPEYEKQRERSHQAAYHILSLLALFLARKQAFHLIADVNKHLLSSIRSSSSLSLVLRTSVAFLVRTFSNLVQLRIVVDLVGSIVSCLSHSERMPSNATEEHSGLSSIGEDYSSGYLSCQSSLDEPRFSFR